MRANITKIKVSKPHNQAFGTVLVRLRRSKKLSQEKLGFDADLTREFVSLLERGQRSPSLDTQLALCAALGISLDQMAAMIVAELDKLPRTDGTNP